MAGVLTRRLRIQEAGLKTPGDRAWGGVGDTGAGLKWRAAYCKSPRRGAGVVMA